MRQIKSRDTGPEMIVRRLLHSMGYRYRLHAKELPGKPDIVFRQRKKAIFVNGCFWHGHSCAQGARVPKTNRDYWQLKIAVNQRRDRRNNAQLTAAGWHILTVWECELKARDTLRETIKTFLGGVAGHDAATLDYL